MLLHFDGLSSQERSNLMAQAVIPRPIAWVLTDSGEKNYNLAPFSYFTPVSSQPAVVMFVVGQGVGGALKDTAINVVERKHMVIHIANADHSFEVAATSAMLKYGESEVQAADLSVVDFKTFKLPRLAECDIALGCTLYDTVSLPGMNEIMVFARIEEMYINDDILSEDSKGQLIIEPNKLNPLSRLGGNQYATLGQVSTTSRPK
uniref:flavin reductase family protein n=1 Tax=Thaumasiovibrio occultus TaxID=1891184 RepID=UPI000B352463|nr:flavin reductase family protein [Thaumasiovibrio occultus]